MGQGPVYRSARFPAPLAYRQHPSSIPETHVNRTLNPLLRTSVAAAAAAAVVVAPLQLAGPHPQLPAPHIAAPAVHLTGITQSDIAALVNNLDGAMRVASSALNGVAATADNTLGGALTATAAVNTAVWSGIIAAAGGPSTPLGALLSPLAASAKGGLAQLNTTVGQVGGTVVLTAGDLTNLLTSVVTGSVSAALNAIANVINNPLNAASYIGLIEAPIGIAGLALQNTVKGIGAVTVGGVQIVGSVITGADNVIKNAVNTANAMIGTATSTTGSDVVAGVITAVQAIVSAPILASLDAISGLTSTTVTALNTTVKAAANGTSSIIGTWLGSGTSNGAIATALNAITAGPLTPQNYATAVSILAGARFTTTATIANTARSLLSMPVNAAASLTTTAAAVLGDLATGMAGAGSGIMRAAGLPSLVYNLPYAAAGTIITAVNVAAGTTSTVLKTLASAIDFANSHTGAAARPAAATDTLTLAASGVPATAATNPVKATGTINTVPDAKTPAAPKVVGERSTAGASTGTANSTHTGKSSTTSEAASTTKSETASNSAGQVGSHKTAPETGTSTAPAASKAQTSAGASTSTSVGAAETGTRTPITGAVRKPDAAVTAPRTGAASKPETTTGATSSSAHGSGNSDTGSSASSAGKASTTAPSANTHSTENASASAAGGRHRAADGAGSADHGSPAAAHSAGGSH